MKATMLGEISCSHGDEYEPCSLMDIDRRFRGVLMMEEVRTLKRRYTIRLQGVTKQKTDIFRLPAFGTSNIIT